MQEVARPAPPALSLYLFPLLLSLSLSPFYPPVPCGPTGPGPGRRTGARRLVCVRVWKRDEGRHHESVRAQGGAGLGRSTGLRLAFPSLSPRSPSGPIRSGLSASAYLSNRAPAARAGAAAASPVWAVVGGGGGEGGRESGGEASAARERKETPPALPLTHLGPALDAGGHGRTSEVPRGVGGSGCVACACACVCVCVWTRDAGAQSERKECPMLALAPRLDTPPLRFFSTDARTPAGAHHIPAHPSAPLLT